MKPKIFRITSVLTKRQLSVIRSKSDFYGLLLVMHAWGIIFACVSLVIFFPNPVSYLVAIILIGSRQLGLLILMHESAHQNLFRTPSLNYWVGQVACALPVFANSEVYRDYHIKHHLNTQKTEDPDFNLTKSYPITKKSFIRKIARDLTGITAFYQRKHQILTAFGNKEMPVKQRSLHFWKSVGKQATCNFVIFFVALYFGYGSFYLILWILPLLTWHQLVLRIRNIAEHAVVGCADNPLRNTRTTIAGFWEKLLVAPYWVNYHLEHHLAMWIPCYRLKYFHKLLIFYGLKEEMEIEYGYVSLLRKIITENPGNDNSQQKSHRVGSFSEGFK